MFSYLSTTEEIRVFVFTVLIGFCVLQGVLSIYAKIKHRIRN